MTPHEPVNILMVDDQIGKLLTYEAILAPLGENLRRANSGREALESLLKSDVAVVLMDVSMPDIDGFQLADMIREHPRFDSTAIIFISAVHLTDVDRLKGYARGAVDYISVPIIPELLRAKVSVFAELYRKNKQLERLNLELEHRVAERTRELQESESQFRSLANSIPQLAWMAHADGSVFWYNQRWYDYTGTSFDQMRGLGWSSLVDHDHVVRVAEGIRRSWSAGEPWEDTFPLRSKSGEYRWFLSRALPIRNEAGDVIRWFGTNTDVTEQIEAENALRESEARFRELADNISQFAWTADAKGWIYWYNRRWHDYTGTTLEDMQGWGWQKVHHPEHVNRVVQRIRQSFEIMLPRTCALSQRDATKFTPMSALPPKADIAECDWDIRFVP